MTRISENILSINYLSINILRTKEYRVTQEGRFCDVFEIRRLQVWQTLWL
jgi:hypothetical protein